MNIKRKEKKKGKPTGLSSSSPLPPLKGEKRRGEEKYRREKKHVRRPSATPHLLNIVPSFVGEGGEKGKKEKEKRAAISHHLMGKKEEKYQRLGVALPLWKRKREKKGER